MKSVFSFLSLIVLLFGCGQAGEILQRSKARTQSEPGPIPSAPVYQAPVIEVAPPSEKTPVASVPVAQAPAVKPPAELPAVMPVPTPPPEPPPPLKVKHSTKISVEGPKKVDLLFVVDNSGSMVYEQKQMASRFNHFIERLSGLDWRLAITTTDVSKNTVGRDGRFLKFPNGQFVLKAGGDLKESQKLFGQTIQRPLREGNQYEQGVKATYRALERWRDRENPENQDKQEFFREDTALGVIFITDADETIPKGQERGTRNQPQELLRYLAAFMPDKNVVFHSIVVRPKDPKCLKANGNESVGATYIELSKATHGVVGSVCEKDYGQQLRQIGEGTQKAVQSWPLDCAGATDLKLLNIDGEDVKIEMDVQQQSVHFSSALPAGQYSLEYNCVQP